MKFIISIPLIASGSTVRMSVAMAYPTIRIALSVTSKSETGSSDNTAGNARIARFETATPSNTPSSNFSAMCSTCSTAGFVEMGMPLKVDTFGDPPHVKRTVVEKLIRGSISPCLYEGSGFAIILPLHRQRSIFRSYTDAPSQVEKCSRGDSLAPNRR